MNAKPITILMTTDTVGGVWTYSLELCRAMKSFHVFFYVVSLGEYPSENQLEEVKTIENMQLFPTSYKLEWMQNPWKDIYRTRKKIDYLIAELQPDLLHFNNFIQKQENWNRPLVTVFHSCVHSWWRGVKGCEPPAEWENYRELVNNALNNSNRVVFPSKSIRNTAHQIYGLKPNSEVIYNGRNLENSRTEPKEDFILCCGRLWDEAKNLKILQKIAAEISWPIYVAGDFHPSEEDGDSSLNNLRFLGKLNSEEMKYWFQRAAIYVNPAKYEPFGLAVLEAASAGCGLVLSNIETLQEIWKENALFFDPEQPKELIRKLNFLIADHGQRKIYQDLAKSASKTFSLDRFSESYSRLYMELLSKDSSFFFLKNISL